MENCKYLCIDTEEAGPAVILFPPFITHVDFCSRYFGEYWWSRNKDCRTKLLSAGFVRRGSEGWYCTGESNSLKLKARPMDTDFLRRMLPEE